MGGNNSKEKFIKEQNASGGQHKAGGGHGGAAAVVPDDIDSPYFELVRKFPIYVKFFVPTIADEDEARDAITNRIEAIDDAVKLSFEGVKIGASDLSLLLPIYCRQAKKLETLNLFGQKGLNMAAVALALRYAPSTLKSVNLQDIGLEGCDACQLVRGLKDLARDNQRSQRSAPIVIEALRGNPFFYTTLEGSTHNEQLASDCDELANTFAIIINHQQIPETPFQINGEAKRVSDINDSVPVGGTYVLVEPYSFETIDKGEEKAETFEKTVSAIIRAQQSTSNRPEGLRYMPRIFHLQKYTKCTMKMVFEDMTRQQSFVPIERLFNQRTAKNWTIAWRIQVALQVAHVAAFAHTLNVGLREVYPGSILVDMQQKRILFTQLGSLRPPGLQTRFHKEMASGGLRLADPGENVKAAFTLAKDIYILAKLLFYFLIPRDDIKEFTTLSAPPVNVSGDLSIPTQDYLKKLNEHIPTTDDENPGQQVSDACKLQIAQLIAECTMKEEMRRPTIAAFVSRLASIYEEATK